MTVRQSVVVLSIGALAVGSCAVRVAKQTSQQDIAGTYRCEGTELGGERYTGWVHVKRTGEIYDVLWTDDAGVISGVGVGLRTDNVLSVVFQTSSYTSVAAYVIGPNGTLGGRWLTGSASAPERLTRASGAPVPRVSAPPSTPHHEPRVRV